jgi:lactate dehydrogenase-like 2-hydroxyacid dehydrogenase
MKEGALLINCSFGRAVDQVALYDELSTGRLRAASDDPMGDVKFKDLPLHTFFCSNGQTAFNTFSAIQKVSDMATQSIINLLSTGKDEYRVN